jgi:hypothetical protein
MTCPCPQAIHAQGKGDCDCSRDASRRALGIESDPMESTTVRWLAALLAVIAVGMVMERLGIPISWPF